MNKIIAFFVALKQRIADRFTLDAKGLLKAIVFIENEIERSLEKTARELNAVSVQMDTLARVRSAKNAEMDAAYKLLHNVSNMVR